jgi:signal transduction histidine kinase
MLLIVALTGTVLSAGFSGPLEEVVDWTRRIRRGEPLPAPGNGRGPAEFATLREALREMQRGLEQARAGELEAERLRAFSEVARRVAHEMKNPLTPIRLAVLQLSRSATPEAKEMLDVIAVESGRLEAMAREFAELGRLPEGVAAPVDLAELLDDLLKSAVPESMARRLDVGQGVGPVHGFYDPLRRAFSNLIRNAVEACHGRGEIAVQIERVGPSIEVRVADNGPGIAADRRDVIFQPYYTEKGDGTGLGLTIVRQTLEQHHGSVAVSETPGGGATFLARIPA